MAIRPFGSNNYAHRCKTQLKQLIAGDKLLRVDHDMACLKYTVVNRRPILRVC